MNYRHYQAFFIVYTLIWFWPCLSSLLSLALSRLVCLLITCIMTLTLICPLDLSTLLVLNKTLHFHPACAWHIIWYYLITTETFNVKRSTMAFLIVHTRTTEYYKINRAVFHQFMAQICCINYNTINGKRERIFF